MHFIQNFLKKFVVASPRATRDPADPLGRVRVSGFKQVFVVNRLCKPKTCSVLVYIT